MAPVISGSNIIPDVFNSTSFSFEDLTATAAVWYIVYLVGFLCLFGAIWALSLAGVMGANIWLMKQIIAAFTPRCLAAVQPVQPPSRWKLYRCRIASFWRRMVLRLQVQLESDDPFGREAVRRWDAWLAQEEDYKVIIKVFKAKWDYIAEAIASELPLEWVYVWTRYIDHWQPCRYGPYSLWREFGYYHRVLKHVLVLYALLGHICLGHISLFEGMLDFVGCMILWFSIALLWSIERAMHVTHHTWELQYFLSGPRPQPPVSSNKQFTHITELFWFNYRFRVWYSYRAAMKFCGFKFASDECPLFDETPSPVFDSTLFEVVPVMASHAPNSTSHSRPVTTPSRTVNQRDSEVNPGVLNFRALSFDDVRAALDDAAAIELAMPEPRTRRPTVVSMGPEADSVPDRSTIFSPVNGVIVEEDATPTILQVILSPTSTAIWGEDESRVSAWGPAWGPASDAADDRTPALSRSSSFTSVATYMAVSGENQSRVAAWVAAWGSASGPASDAADDRTPALSRSSSFTSVATYVTAVSGDDQPRVSARGPALDAADDTTPALSRSSSFASVARPTTPV